ncbi:MAG: helix-turn-helix transcriptional regulator [Oscillospiraceae bacterium]
MRVYLKDLRAREKLTQADLAKKIGMTQQNYSLIEKGQRQIDMGIHLLSKLADIFNIPIAELIALEKKADIHEK